MPRLFLFLLLVTLDVVMRLAQTGLHSTPVLASALLAAYVFERRAVALAVPLTAMLLSDFFLGLYDVRIMASVYLSLAFPPLLGSFFRRKLSVGRLLGASLLSSAVFFLVTNFAVWAFSSLYPHTAQGLGMSLVAGLPFLRYTMAGDLVWTALLFGAWAAARPRVPVQVAPATAG